MKIACLVTGKVRFDDAAQIRRFNEVFSECDVYIASYQNERHAASVCNRGMILINESSVPVDVPFTGANHLFLLQRAVQSFASILCEYDVIMRVRTDCVFTDDFRVPTSVHADRMHMLSDNFFFASAKLFIRMCRNVYSDFCRLKYHETGDTVPTPNWRNLQESVFIKGRNHYPTRWYCLWYPVFLFDRVAVPNAECMQQIVRKHIDKLCSMTDRCSRSEMKRLAPPRIRMVDPFDVEASLLHYFLTFAPVMPTACENTVLLRP